MKIRRSASAANTQCKILKSTVKCILFDLSFRIKITALLPEDADDSATLIQKLGIYLFYNDCLFYFYKTVLNKM